MKFRQIHILFFSLLLSITSYAQDSSLVSLSVVKTNLSQQDIIFTSLLPDGAITNSPILEDYISSWTLDEADGQFPIKITSSEADFKNHTSEMLKLKIPSYAKFGTACFNALDSAIVFSVMNGANSSIYYKAKNKDAELVLKGTSKAQYFHPFLSADGSQLFYTSNEADFADNFNIYFLNLSDGKWGKPIKLSAEINSEENELFPTWYDDTLYFSLESNNQLDIYSSAKLDQYKIKTRLDEPINSEYDDFLFHKKNDAIQYITSNRLNQADQPFLIEKQIYQIKEKMILTGYIACTGNRISNVPITLKNIFGIRIDNDITDQNGNFILRADKQIKNYKLKLENDDPRIRDCAVLYITDENGNVIQKVATNKEGEFVFELLAPDDINALNLIPLEDESLLQIEINGQIYENEPGDIGDGEPVYIISDNGVVAALAYTSSEGKFKFTDLSPEAEYKLKFNEAIGPIKVNIIEELEVIALEVIDNQAVFERIEDENALKLKDETGKEITIKKNEFFSIPNIFYEFDSDRLTSQAKIQLKRLAQFIFNNDQINIELTSHTDSRGKEYYNQALSQKRALSAIAYLESLGVPSSRMVGYGMGEKDLLNGCIEGINCTEEEHAINRRTEIRILEPE